jgi:hypothetical protein
MAIVDSAPVFEARCIALGVDPDDIKKLKVSEMITHAQFAFATTYQPGQADDSAFTSMLRSCLGRDVSNSRRLIFD